MRTSSVPLAIGWRWAELGELIECIDAGRSPRALDRPAQSSEVGVPRVGRGDLLMSRANTLDLVGAVVRVREDHPDLMLSDKILRLVPIATKASSRYLLYALRTGVVRSYLERCASGTSGSMRNVSQDQIKKVPIPLPVRLEEQRRIADILDKADAIRRKRQEAIRLLEDLVRSAFLEMFGDPVTNPKGWPQRELRELGTFVGGGTPRRDVPEYFKGSICWATSKDIQSELLDGTQEHVSEAAVACSATRVVGPQALFIVVKSKILMHRLPVAISTVPACFSQDIKAFIPHESRNVRYLARHLRLGQQAILRLARGVNTEGLTLDHLRSYRVMTPPVPMMVRYGRFEAVFERAYRNQQWGLAAAAEAIASLTRVVFAGVPAQLRR